MAISIFTNIAAGRAVLNVNRVADDLAQVTERLASGLRFRYEAPAAFVAADHIEGKIRGLQGADANIQMAIAALDISDAALETIQDSIVELIDLAVQGANGLLTAAEYTALDTEFQAIVDSIDELIADTTLGGTSLLDGSYGSVTLQVGADTGSTTTVDFSEDFRTTGGGPLGAINGLSVADQASATAAVDALTGAAPAVDLDFTAARALLSAPYSTLVELADHNSEMRLEYESGRLLMIGADLAAETSRLVRDQLLLDAGASALSAANFSASTIVEVLSASVGRSK